MDVVEYAPQKSALLFRCLDVTAAAFMARPRLVQKVLPSHIDSWGRLLELDFAIYSYKVMDWLAMMFIYTLKRLCW